MQGFNNFNQNPSFSPAPYLVNNSIPASGYFNQQPAYTNQPQQQVGPGPNGLRYVHGIEGAYAYNMLPGETQVILWDDTDDSFYIKGYDNMGKPKVLAWNDFKPHVENRKPQQQQRQVDMSQYLTKKDLDKIISQLTIGEQGRIVRVNEHDA